MSGKLTAVERQEKADKAVELSAKGWTNPEIAEEIGVHRHTVRKLIADELAGRAEHREQDKERAIATYVALIREGWRRLETMDDRSLNVSGILNSIKSAQDSINKITGVEAPKKIQHLDQDEWEVVWDDLDPAEVSGEDTDEG